MKLYVYGAGCYGKSIVGEIQKSCNVDLLIDKYSEESSFNGVSIVRLSQSLDKDAIVYIAISDTFLEPMVVQELKAFGFTNLISLNDTLKAFPGSVKKILDHTIWYTKDQNQLLNHDKISSIRDLFSDQKSLDLLSKIVDFRKRPSFDNYVEPETEGHYFAKDIGWEQAIDDIRFIDGGAYTGDTISHLVDVSSDLKKRIDYAVCFEPDRKNRERLVSILTKYQNRFGKYFVFPSGLWSEESILGFSPGNGSCSHVSNAEAGDYIMGVSIDTALLNSEPNFIKMDIEGAEEKAIIGAKKVIEKYSPILAIAIYHKAEDLWRIPMLINSINSSYNMYLRVYGSFFQELVLYCVPKK